MKPTTRLTKILRVSAVLALIATASTWAGTGAHVGWTQTTLTTLQRDEITGIDYPVYRTGFVAGVEVLLIGTAAAAALAVSSIFSQRRSIRA
jgi:hypothetical protein